MPGHALNAALRLEWAMRPAALENLLTIAARENEDPEAVALQLGRKLDNTRRVTMRDGVAVVPVVGPIFRRANLFTEVSGATSTEVLARDLHEAVQNEGVKAILLDVDSPGGEAAGLSELATLISQMGKKKPIHAYVGGAGCSGAYWLAAACETITISPTAILGSIGVVAALRKADGSSIEIVSDQSPDKRLDVETEEGQAKIRGTLNDLAAVFVADVAKYRGVSEQTVLADFGRGGVKVGRAAVKAGMADRLGTLEGTLRKLASGNPPQKRLAAEADLGAEAEDGWLPLVEAREAAGLGEPTADAEHDLEALPAGASFAAELDTLHAGVERAIERARGIHAMRAAAGRTLSHERRAQLAGLRDGLETLLRETEPAPKFDRQALDVKALALQADVQALLVGS